MKNKMLYLLIMLAFILTIGLGCTALHFINLAQKQEQQIDNLQDDCILLSDMLYDCEKGL